MSIKRTITIGDRKRKTSLPPAEPAFRRKPNPKGKRLVVVESPAKARTIERILGPDYKVMASMGHLRDLPKRTLGVDIDHGFAPQYVNADGRETVIKELQKEANQSRDVLLATDPDREGEAISWHLSRLLDVNPADNVRIAFHEITPPAIREAVAHPGPIDENRVDAQQARRVLDRLVGYKLSPWLWKQVYRGLSAGRVQSVAVRLICEREEEIKAFHPEEYWTIEGKYRTADNHTFKARLTHVNGQEAKLHNKEEADAVLATRVEQSVIAGYDALAKAVGFKLYSIDLGLAAPIKAVRTIPDLQQKTFVLLQFDDDTISACLFVQGQYTYSTRSRLFNPRGSAESGTEIAQKLSGLIQFHTTSKSEHRIETVCFAGSTADDLAVCRPGCEALGLQVDRFPDSPTVRLPSGTALADVLYAAGNLIAR